MSVSPSQLATLPAFLLFALALGCGSDGDATGPEIAGAPADGSASPTPSSGGDAAPTAGVPAAGAPVAGPVPSDGAGDGAADAAGSAAASAGGSGGMGAAGEAAAPAPSGGSAGEPPASGGEPADPVEVDDGPVAIDPPIADDCITDVSPGDHSFTCQGVTFDVLIDPHCTEFACGLIFEVHGASMTGPIMRANTNLHELGAAAGYLVVHPTSPTGTWDWATHPQILVDFMDRMVAAFHVDARRIHMTGFSMGSAMTFWFLCNHREVLASVGPVTGSSADQVLDEATGDNCIQSIDSDWQPRVPILFMSGTTDGALTAAAAMERTDGIVSRLGLEGGDEIDSGDGWRRRRWTGDDGMVFDFLTHDYGSLILAGHCIPGIGSDIFACSGANLHWGETVLQWFVDHPKPRM